MERFTELHRWCVKYFDERVSITLNPMDNSTEIKRSARKVHPCFGRLPSLLLGLAQPPHPYQRLVCQVFR